MAVCVIYMILYDLRYAVIADEVKQSRIFAVFLDCFFASLIAMTSFVGVLCVWFFKDSKDCKDCKVFRRELLTLWTL